MSKLKIGITTREEASIWSNGLDQNIYFLYKMLEDMGYEPHLISESFNAKKLQNKAFIISAQNSVYDS